MAFEAKTVVVDGLTVSYWEGGQGNGRTLLLIHGGLGDASLHWGPVAPLLTEEFHILAPDLPGFGGSQPLAVRRTNALMHWLTSFLNALGIEQAVVVGNSLGGLIARLFAANSPQLVPAVILLNGGAVPDFPPMMRLLERVPGLSHLLFSQITRASLNPTSLRAMLRVENILTDDFMRGARAAAPGFSRLLRMIVASPLPQQQTPLVPTLILWGTNDQVATLAGAESIKNSIPGAVLTEIADCGHMPQLETPDVFVWQVSNFLQKLSRPQRDDLPGAGMLPPYPG
ncbi:MAG: alpha/beta hydrolase [Chloroflexi bacterium]|nr:alpha/beta hydrolase [Chloroflexota bacterium]